MYKAERVARQKMPEAFIFVSSSVFFCFFLFISEHFSGNFYHFPSYFFNRSKLREKTITKSLDTIDIIWSVDNTENCNKPFQGKKKTYHSVSVHEKAEIVEERAQELLFSLIRNESHPSRCLLCASSHCWLRTHHKPGLERKTASNYTSCFLAIRRINTAETCLINIHTRRRNLKS